MSEYTPPNNQLLFEIAQRYPEWTIPNEGQFDDFATDVVASFQYRSSAGTAIRAEYGRSVDSNRSRLVADALGAWPSGVQKTLVSDIAFGQKITLPHINQYAVLAAVNMTIDTTWRRGLAEGSGVVADAMGLSIELYGSRLNVSDTYRGPIIAIEQPQQIVLPYSTNAGLRTFAENPFADTEFNRSVRQGLEGRVPAVTRDNIEAAIENVRSLESQGTLRYLVRSFFDPNTPKPHLSLEVLFGDAVVKAVDEVAINQASSGAFRAGVGSQEQRALFKEALLARVLSMRFPNDQMRINALAYVVNCDPHIEIV